MKKRIRMKKLKKLEKQEKQLKNSEINNMEKIYRSLSGVRSMSGRTISGTAVVFDSWSEDLGGFKEIIRSSALTQQILDESDIMANMDHDPAYVMARRKNGHGNLQLTLTQRGLDFSFECPDTAKGEELLQHIKRGEYDSCSFCFTLAPDGDRWYNVNGEMRREILKFDKIFDVAIVYTPAYAATSVDARSKRKLDAVNKLDKYINEINSVNLYE